MGNIGSQTGQISQRISPEEQWAHSFPRSQPTRLQHKVLPDRDSRQKLRPTNNGEILNSGGTLTGRQPYIRNVVDRDDEKRLSDNKENNSQPRSYVSNQRYSLHKLGYRSNHYIQHKQNAASQRAIREQRKLFGSEPDLRYSTRVVSIDQEIKDRKTKKKYKAPPPPNVQMNENTFTEWEENSSDNESPPRKPRLFKTRVETKKHSSHVNKTEHNEHVQKLNRQIDDSIQRRLDNNNIHKFNRLSLPELQSVENTDFQKELKEATKRLRNMREETSTTMKYNLTENNRNKLDEKEKLKTLDASKENMKKKFKEIIQTEENNNIVTSPIHCVRGEPSGKESSTPELSPHLTGKDKMKDKPKTFYFGMDNLQNNHTRNDLFSSKATKILNSSESDISSDLEPDDAHISNAGIDLQLRPILPKKQLEIPRFSPAAAWKLLSTMDSNQSGGTIASDDIPVFIEEKIEKYARPPPPPTIQIGQRSNNDKSGDSGISGDAGPVGFDDNGDVVPVSNSIQKGSYLRRQDGISWTPQQDLEDDSSLEELNLETDGQKSRRALAQLNKPHVFSLSLPRDNQLAAYMIERTTMQCSGLKKLKRSVSGVLCNLSSKKDLAHSNLNQDDASNWFFSKSAPNSLNNGFNSLEARNILENEQSVFSSSLSKTARVMYLPELKNNNKQKETNTKQDERMDREEHKYKLSVYSKSCDDIVTEMKKAPETLQDPPNDLEYIWKSNKKTKKFTFQSTVRQIERRRMAEKLSKEAEKKEKQRLRELEAMQKVEEEFQKKRAREKANIRQQLRLYCMDDSLMWSSLPPSLEVKNEVRERQEPDGAFSSSTGSSSPPLPVKCQNFPKKSTKRTENKVKAPVTQELSEYRQIQREYKDYRGNIKYSSDNKYPKQTTVHPQITCNMPKAKGSTVVNGNYRKEFACGVKSTKSGGSTHSEDSQNNSPKMYHNKYAPITRF